MNRQCGECSLCCRLLPVKELSKKANTRCQHQRLTGCKIYADRPISCMLWSCRWLVQDDVAGLPRPDRAGYVIDLMADFVVVNQGMGGGDERIQVMQDWCDPKRPDAWKTKELKAYMERRASEDAMATIIRYSNEDAIVVFPPALMADRKWLFRHSTPNFDLKPEEAWQND